MFERARQHLVWLLGFLLMANLYLVPTLAASPRATDLVGMVLGLWALRRLAMGRLPVAALAVLALVDLGPIGWLFMSLLNPDQATLAQSARWLLAAPWALALLVFVQNEDACQRFAWGLVWGGATNIAVIIAQFVGLEGLLRRAGLSSNQSVFYYYVYNTVRIPGLHGTPNASAAIVSLVVPASFYLYFRKRVSLLIPLAALGGFAIALSLTSTRSPLLVTVVFLAYAFVVAREVGRALLIGTLVIALVVPALLVFGPPGGRSRWEDTMAIQVNASERLETNRASVGLALAHPLGLGVTQGKEALYDAAGISATHDAFLQAAVFLGLPLALALITAMLALIARGIAGGGSPTLLLLALLAFHTTGLFLFEEHLNNPSFVILASWFIVAASRLHGRGMGVAGSVVEDLAPVPIDVIPAEGEHEPAEYTQEHQDRDGAQGPRPYGFR